MQATETTPMMAQWHQCKNLAKDAVLLFRMGDFYEAFYEDAVLISKELDLTLTRRADIPMAGIPHHTSEGYIDRLVSKGHRVAVAEQTEDPKKAKGLVKREVVRIVTPGTIINSSLLSERANNFFACISRVGSLYGLAVLDLTTADFRVIEFDKEPDLINEIFRLRPSEILVSTKFKEKHEHLFTEMKLAFDMLLSVQDDWKFDHQTCYDFLVNHFKVHNLDGFGLKGMVATINAAGALLHYLHESLSLNINHIRDILPYSTSQFMTLDRITQRNLELTESLHDGSRKNTLLSVLDKTQTPMGARMMRHWVKQPLLSTEDILKRQEAIQLFLQNHTMMDRLCQLFESVRDLERLMMKISSGYASPRDIASLKISFEPIPQIKGMLLSFVQDTGALALETQKLDGLPTMIQLIERSLVEEPPMRLTDGKIFREGFNRELDELRELSTHSKSWIAQYQTSLRESTGIKTLKVGFNRMFGYYIEVSKGQADKMPDSFLRRQTLVNAERYITPELKDYENKVLNAEERMLAIETELFHQLRQEVAQYAPQVMRVAQALARIDCLLGLAQVARQHDYRRPIVDHSQVLQIVDGRHPVIEASRTAEKFIPNDTLLDDKLNRLLLITGPNMAGKSTYIRQVALITIMAQIGSFVPAKSAHIGLVDKVFTRIGASDDLSRGQSTFMVEMTETANILNNATSRSLVILDEIGRGTSTYDGISIAWSVAEYLLTAEDKMAKTLFATHYWELTKLEEKVPGAVNYNVAVNESEDNIVFLRKIIRGGTDKSYGIHVGRLAGLPEHVISRAKEILVHLEENANRKGVFEPGKTKRAAPVKPKPPKQAMQLSFFG
jgi:DNA mismatch repair protein MutS